ncbi:hypothetical protein A2524_01425 [Candidatus Wolfebacteria bacterium RIFOXYD12_FULL_48_21]|uniref:Uncharacterized protein n=1 Tax=Candidatus Wolfebacteria bacterium RIFOXYD1_FULL_48_65 TaxID=1802561 RepID=A0A1F8DYT6_9BACT|nr:MAG: hypothetical protein A2610_00610 [Candidatus Wolfebacteria bacterium RIFOXYD1_FULL_48_65]OGM94467.1 MAG: hypothetical protein A2524_01425 [Candidatus Wolfebacteria bacterium RIFOXYD12_FULL_48_21]OGM97935.1 MAG: hypothetical protein A2532_04335 [Candidatus Wolfebacteria bacterium RIFOXYD2_FULL_48_11]
MNKKIAVGVVGLVIVAGVAGIAANTTYARGGMVGGNVAPTAAVAAQRETMEAHRTAVDAAIQAGDYTAWKAAMSSLPGNGRGAEMTSGITEANFGRFVEMHKLMGQADAIRQELGMGERGGMGQGMHGRGQGRGMKAQAAATQ